MVAGNLRLILPDLYDKTDSAAPISIKLFPATSSTDEESVSYFKKNNKFTFGANALDFSIAIPFEVLIYSNDKWIAGRTGFLHMAASANIERLRKGEVDEINLSKVKLSIKNIKFYDPEAESEDEREMTNE